MASETGRLSDSIPTGEAPEADVIPFPEYLADQVTRARHISVDVETFDNTPDAALAAIGAATTGPTSDFYVVVDDYGGSYSPGTIRWHARQENVEDNVGQDPIPLRRGLAKFAEFLESHRADEEGHAQVWSHATFDMPVLKSAYRRVGVDVPWHRRNTRDLRTLYELAGGRPDLENENPHNALADARYQLREILECLDRTGSLSGAKKSALEDYEHWREVTGVWPKTVSRDGEIRGIIEDAVELGYRAGQNDS